MLSLTNRGEGKKSCGEVAVKSFMQECLGQLFGQTGKCKDSATGGWDCRSPAVIREVTGTVAV